MPNCVQDPSHDCFGLAEAEILKHQMETMKEQLEQDRKDRKRDTKNNKKDHKEFFRRMEFAEKSQALTQNQLAQILQTSLDIKAGQDKQHSDIQEIKTAQQSHSASIASLEKQQEEQDKELKTITTKPAKNWENLKSTIFAMVVTAVVTLVLAKIGLTS